MQAACSVARDLHARHSERFWAMCNWMTAMGGWTSGLEIAVDASLPGSPVGFRATRNLTNGSIVISVPYNATFNSSGIVSAAGEAWSLAGSGTHASRAFDASRDYEGKGAVVAAWLDARVQHSRRSPREYDWSIPHMIYRVGGSELTKVGNTSNATRALERLSSGDFRSAVEVLCVVSGLLEAQGQGNLAAYLDTLPPPSGARMWALFPNAYRRTHAAWKRLLHSLQREAFEKYVHFEFMGTDKEFGWLAEAGRIDHATLVALYADHPDPRVRATVCNPVKYVRALLAFSTRNFAHQRDVPGQPLGQSVGRSLVPVLDLVNHHTSNQLTFGPQVETGRWVARVLRPVGRGEHVYVNYKGGEDAHQPSGRNAVTLFMDYDILDHSGYQVVARLGAQEGAALERMPLSAFAGWSTCEHCSTTGRNAARSMDRMHCPPAQIAHAMSSSLHAHTCWELDGEQGQCPLSDVTPVRAAGWMVGGVRTSIYM